MDESLATTEGQPQRCQVCEFPKIAGKVEGEIAGERYSLRLCEGCFKYAILVLRAQYKQKRLFDDDFDFVELDGFGRSGHGDAVHKMLNDADVAGTAKRGEDAGMNDEPKSS
ncbi:hypothetical protein [Pseudomonas paraeruginosa]|uniref:hypothetical protein n=1 Tax=Pseudomonas paraeruginosa TaxID=2994495 RepID=UPI0039FDCD66